MAHFHILGVIRVYKRVLPAKEKYKMGVKLTEILYQSTNPIRVFESFRRKNNRSALEPLDFALNTRNICHTVVSAQPFGDFFPVSGRQRVVRPVSRPTAPGLERVQYSLVRKVFLIG